MSNPNKDQVDFANLIKNKFTMRKDIAPVEDSSTASRAYSAGDLFYYGNLLQRATQDIAQGAGFAAGVNFENADPLGTQFGNIANQVSSLELTNAVNIIPFNCVSRDIYTVHSDGSVDMVNSSAGSGETRLYYIDTTESQFSFIKGKRYKLKVFGTFPSNCTFNINFWDGSSFVDSIWTAGDVKDFEWKSTYKGLRIVIIAQKSVVMNTTLKPMIVPEDFPITEWLPVAQGNAILTQNVNGLISNAKKCGCVNHLIFDLAHIKSINIAGSWSGNVYTHNGVQFTVNDNGTVTAHRDTTNSNVAVLYYASKPTGIDGLEAVPYKLCGCPSGGSNAYRMVAKSLDSNYYDDTGNGINIPSKLLNYISCAVTGAYTGSDITFKPMVADADMPDANYANWVPYAKTNRELTEDTTVVNEYSRVTNVNSKITPALSTNSLIVVRYGKLVTFHVYIGDATGLTAWSEELLKLPTDLAPYSDLYMSSGGNTGKQVVLRNTGSLNVATGSETLHGNSFDATYICRG